MSDSGHFSGARAKRPRPDSSPTGDTPQGKKTKSTILKEILQDLFVVVPDNSLCLRRGFVVEKIEEEIARQGVQFGAVTPQLVGKALTQAFPTLGRSGKDHLTLPGLCERRPAQRPTEPMETRATSVDPQAARTHSLLVTADEKIFIQAMRTGKLPKNVATPATKELITKLVVDIVNGEVDGYARTAGSMLRDSNVDALLNFSLSGLGAELRQLLPTLTTIVSEACSRKQMGRRKSLASIQAAISTVIAKILATYSNSLCVWRHISALQLSSGGVKDSCMNRLAKTYDSVMAITCRRKLNAMAGVALEPLTLWTTEGSTYTIVFDNVNKHVKARSQTATRGNTMHNLTHALAIRNRIDVSGLPTTPLTPVNNLQSHDLLPGPDHAHALKAEMAIVVRQIWAKFVPALEWMDCVQPEHKYSSCSQLKTEKVNLGVLQLDECKKDEMLEVLKTYHGYVPIDENGDVSHTMVAGDYLSFSNGKSVQQSQADNVTPADRLDGIILCMADFHAEMNLLDLIFRILYEEDSNRSAGTIQAAKNILHTTNIKKKASKTYYDSSELFDKLLTAYIILGALKKFNLSDTDGTLDTPMDERTEATADRYAHEFIEEFVRLEVPTREHVPATHLSCQHCNRRYRTVKNLLSHHREQHPDEYSVAPTEDDSVYAYTSSLITLGLTRQVLNRNIQVGNGENIMMVYRFMAIMTKAHGQYNYGTGLLETIMQTYILPQDLAESMVWNRFANNRGESDSNIPLDLHLEHENRGLKDDLKAYRGVYTQEHLDRISRARSLLEHIIRGLDEELRSVTGNKPQRELSESDIRMLVTRIMPDNVLERVPGRRLHSHSLSFVKENPMQAIGGDDLRNWIAERLAITQTKHYYKQFC